MMDAARGAEPVSGQLKGDGAGATTSASSERIRSRLNSRPLLLKLFLLKFLESYAYFIISLSLTVYLSKEFGFSDMSAGWIYGGFGVACSGIGILAGPVIDRLGVKWSLVLGAAISAVSRLALTMTRSSTSVLVILFGIMPLGVSLGMPVMTIAIKRYTNSHTAVDGYSWFYAVMNLAALLSGLLTDALRNAWPNGAELFGSQFSDFRLIFLSGSVASLLLFFIALFSLEEVNVTKTGLVEDHRRKLAKEPVSSIIASVCADRTFWRLVLYGGVMSFSRMVFRQLDAGFPKYMMREFGSRVNYGLLFSLNPLVVIIAAPLIGTLTQRVSPYNMSIAGSIVTAASVFLLVGKAKLVLVVLFLVLLSLGEAAYSPRVYQLTMDYTPPGHEGVYTALASAPFFIAKLFAGGLSGALLEDYCPENPPRQCGTMWLVIAVMTLCSPILLFLFRPCIETKISADTTDGARDEEGTSGERKPLTSSTSEDPNP